jgi:hypothetical protein
MPKDTVKSSEVLQAPTEKEFAALLRAVKSHEADKNEAVGSLGSVIQQAIVKKHLDRKAFTVFRGLARMSDKKLATTLAHLDHYIEIGGLNARILLQGELIGRDTELAETKVSDVQTNGHRKTRKDKPAPVEQAAAPAKPKGKKGSKKKTGNVVTFDSQRDREGSAEFGEAVDGPVH